MRKIKQLINLKICMKKFPGTEEVNKDAFGVFC